MQPIRIEFRNNPKLYQGRYLEIRNTGSQIRFYEISIKPKREYCLSREVIQWLVHTGSLPRTNLIKNALRGDKSIFHTTA